MSSEKFKFIHAGYGYFITHSQWQRHKCKQHKTRTTDTFWTYKYIFVFYIFC